MKKQTALKQILAIGCAGALMVSLQACETLGGRGPTAGASGIQDMNSPDLQNGDQQGVMPPDVMKIPGLPVPDGAEVLLGDTVMVGQDDSWTGQIVMSVPDYSPVQVVEFIRTRMPDYGWKETAIVRSRRTSITYVKTDRFATVRVMPGDKGADLDIIVAPMSQQTGAGQ